ncbi:MAG: caspase family protein, partial [Thermoflexales bacterium]|nr:caspase family protein [Thermoflexales bacterium]
SSLRFNAASFGSILDYAVVRYGGGEYNENVLVGANDVTVQDSLIAIALGDGMRIENASPIIRGNDIRDNTGSAIAVLGASAAPDITINKLWYNGWGVYAWSGAQPTINYNIIYSNTNYGVRNDTASVCLDGRHNYWGDGGGPNDTSAAIDACGLGSHANPAGDKASDNVNYGSFYERLPFFVWSKPDEPWFHDVESLEWAVMALEPVSPDVTAEVYAFREITASTLLGSNLQPQGSLDWDTRGVPDGWYALRVTFRDGADQVLGEATRQVLVNNSVAWHAGLVTAGETWSAAITHVVESELVIPTSVTLTIEAGAVVKFVPGVGISIQPSATLDAATATAAMPITLTAWTDDTSGGDTNLDGPLSRPLPGDWDGLTMLGSGQAKLNEYVALRYVQVTHAGALAGDESWGQQFMHHVTGDVVVASGQTLTIQPGAIVKFDAQRSLVVQAGGWLVARGNGAQPILLTSIKDDAAGGDSNHDGESTAPAAGDWGGVNVDGGQASLGHVVVSYGGGTPSGGWSPAAITVKSGGSIALANSTLREALFDGAAAWGSGTLVVSNTIIAGADRAVNADGSTSVRLLNCTLDLNRIGIWGHGGTLLIENTIVANSVEAGVDNILSSPLTIRYSDVWSETGVDYNRHTDQTGQNGNVSVDPRFKNAAGGNYRLRYASPVIDAADGTVAPEADWMGAPRYDDPRMPNTGITTTSGVWADMGAFEFVEGANSNIDLVVTQVSGPSAARPGDKVTLQWTVVNSGTEAAVGPWHDAILLIAHPDGRPTLTPVGEVLVAEGQALGAGQSASFSAEVTVPPAPVGSQYWQVAANSRGEVFEGHNGDNNVGLSLVTVTLDMPELLVGGPPTHGQFTTAGESHWFKLIPPAGLDLGLSLELAGSGAVELYAARGYLPTRYHFDAQSRAWDASSVSLSIADTVTQVYYILAYARALSQTQGYSLTAGEVDFQVSSVTPDRGGNSGSVTVKIEGDAFPQGATARLVAAGGTAITPTVALQVGRTTLWATFDLGAAPAGLADVEIEAPGGVIRTLPNAFAIAAGGAPDFWFELDGPADTRAGRQVVFELRWGNRGTVDAPMHLLDLKVPGNVEIALSPEGVPEAVRLMLLTAATDVPAAVVPPGYSDSLKLYMTPGLIRSFSLDYGATAIDDARLAGMAIDWDAMGLAARPEGLTDEEWNALWGQLESQLGSNWSSLLQALAQDALALNRTDARPSSGVTVLRALLAEIDRAILAGGQTQAQLQRVRSALQGSAKVHYLGIFCEEYSAKENLPAVKEDRKHIRKFLDDRAQVPSSQRTELADEVGRSDDTITKTMVTNALSALAASGQSGDTIVFHYSGHGDVNSLNLANDTIIWKRLYDILNASQASHIVVVLDSCYSGGFTSWLRSRPGVDANRWTVVAAASETQTSKDGWFSSAFYTAMANGKSLRDAWNDNRSIGTWTYNLVGLGLHQEPQWFGDNTGLQLRDPQGEVKDGTRDHLGQDDPSSGGNSRNTRVNVRGSFDPNEKDTAGYGPEGYIIGQQPILFTIYFENDPAHGATAPVQELLITDTLSPLLDWSTFELTDVRFGDEAIGAAPGLDSLETVATLAGDVYPVQVSAGLDRTTGLVRWYFASRDTVTQDLPEDPLAGFLPVNDESGRGQGYVSFRVRPKANLASGTKIYNKATITFDSTYGVNPPIVTNPVTNTIDLDPPTSSVAALPLQSTSPFTVSWAGGDGSGSGVAFYDVYTSTGGGPFALWQAGITATQATFSGTIGLSYGFYSVATDNVGHRQATPATAQASTTITTSVTPSRSYIYLPVVVKQG